MPDASLLGTADPGLVELEKDRHNMLMDLIGLSECADTYVGNDMVRGKSKKLQLGLLCLIVIRITHLT